MRRHQRPPDWRVRTLRWRTGAVPALATMHEPYHDPGCGSRLPDDLRARWRLLSRPEPDVADRSASPARFAGVHAWSSGPGGATTSLARGTATSPLAMSANAASRPGPDDEASRSWVGTGLSARSVARTVSMATGHQSRSPRLVLAISRRGPRVFAVLVLPLLVLALRARLRSCWSAAGCGADVAGASMWSVGDRSRRSSAASGRLDVDDLRLDRLPGARRVGDWIAATGTSASAGAGTGAKPATTRPTVRVGSRRGRRARRRSP